MSPVAGRDGSQLEPLMRPRAIAVIGASPDAGKPGARCLAMLRRFGYAGSLYAVNPRYSKIGEVPCYPEVSALPQGVDLVLCAIPAAVVVDTIRAAGRHGIGAAIVFSSGFAETGDVGAELQQALADAANETGIRLVGPNSLGLMDLNRRLAATYTTALDTEIEFSPGPIALVSQSGAMGSAIFGAGQSEGVAIGAFISTGNEVVLDYADYVRYFAERPDTSVVLGYLEGTRDGRRMIEAARFAHRRGTRLAVLKVGHTDVGAVAAQSHTGALAGDARVYEAAFAYAGITTVSSPRELLDAGIALAANRVPRGGRVAIVSTSGGAGVMMSDRCAQLGFELAQLAQDTKSALRDVLPTFTAPANPVDLGGLGPNAVAMTACLRAVAVDPGVDIVFLFVGLSPTLYGDLDRRIAELQGEVDSVLMVSWLGPPDGAIASLRASGIPAFEDPIRAVDAAARLLTASRPLAGEPGDTDPARAERLRARLRRLKDGPTDEHSTRNLLSEYDVPFVAGELVESAGHAVAAAGRLDGPVAVKAAGLLHKTENHGVRLGVSASDAGEAFRAVTAGAGSNAAMVQQMARPGQELLIGTRHDPQFGPVVVVGLGGIEAEALADVAVAIAPLTYESALSLVRSLRAAALFGPFRGRPARDVDAAARLVAQVGTVAADAGPLIGELDLNPVRVYEEGAGCLVLDAAAIVATRAVAPAQLSVRRAL